MSTLTFGQHKYTFTAQGDTVRVTGQYGTRTMPVDEARELFRDLRDNHGFVAV